MTRRHSGEGSIYPVKDGYRGYVWCINSAGRRYRKYVKAKTYDATRQAWLKLRDEASRGPVSSDVQKLADFLAYWLEEVVAPNLAPKTYEKYEAFSRLHIVPYLGGKRLDKLQVRDIRQWLNKLATTCLCCTQGKDAARLEEKRRCCAIGKCCHEVLSARSRKDARDTLRAALTCAVEDEIITRNPVTAVKLSGRRESRRRKRQAWTVDDARWFLESAWHAGEALYAAFVLILVLGLRKGEVLGLTWELVDLDAAELYIGEQLQRVGGQLLRREVKTETSEAPLPLPGLCVTASTGASWLRGFPGSPCTAPARLAPRCWPPLTSTRVSLCASCGTARSPSRWRSTPRFPRPPPARRSRSSASGSARTPRPRCCTLLLHQDRKRPVARSQPAAELGGRYWDRTSDLLGVNEALSR